MFENEIKFISDFTLNKVKELGSFITVEKLLSTDIHPAIKKYVEGEIDYLIFEDRKKLIENSLFDYSGKEISNYFDLIGAEIKKTKKISYEDIKNIILQAVSFNSNYVVRPKWSLAKLIFGNNKSVSINEIQMMLNYTYYYEYLNSVFLAYLSKKKILNISVTEFELIMNKIDRELFMLHQSKLVDNALYAIADYYSIGGLNKSVVTIEAVENFLKEKNLTELLFKLKRAYSNVPKKKTDIDEVRKVLYSTLSIDSPFTEESEKQEVLNDDKHFDNPLKENFIIDEHLDEPDNLVDKETIFDLKSEAQSEIFNEESDSENISYESQVKFSSEDEIDSNENQTEHYVKELVNLDDRDSKALDDEIESEKELDIHSTIVDDGKIADSLNLNEELPQFENTESKLPLDNEEVLANLTNELEINEDDEIIILDDKEQEDLLNFYDNELEISIDDDSQSESEISLTNTNSDEDLELVNLSLEHEVPITDELDDEIPIENLDFAKDLAVEEIKDRESITDKDSKKSSIKKSGDDIFNYLSNKEIDRIIKNLFNSDSEDFANTIEKMSACNTFEEADHMLENVFKYARIKPHSRDAAMLSNAVAKYFNVEK
ncbi:MAG: hypothetical protein WAU11_03850 [Ignavibacteriaceae bacterium]